MGDLALYCNVEDFSFSLSPGFATPVENPIRLPQGSTLAVSLFFVEPTGNPASPWTFLDPAAYTAPQISLSQTNQAIPPFLAKSTSFTYVAGSPASLTTNLLVNSDNLILALGSSPGLKAVLEMDWINGTSQYVIQCACIVTRSALSSAYPPPVPPSVGSFTMTQTLGAGVMTVTFDYSAKGLVNPPTNIIPTLVASGANEPNISLYGIQWTSTGFTANLSSPTPDDTYIATIFVIP